MLVITRRIDERVVLTVPGPTRPIEVIVHISDVFRGRVSLAIDAPPAVIVSRESISPPALTPGGETHA